MYFIVLVRVRQLENFVIAQKKIKYVALNGGIPLLRNRLLFTCGEADRSSRGKLSDFFFLSVKVQKTLFYVGRFG